MQITITRRQAEQIGMDSFAEWGFDRQSFRWGDAKAVITLHTLKPESLEKLQALLTSFENVYGIKGMLKDIERWNAAMEDGASGNMKVRDCKTFETLLTAYMTTIPGQRVYKKHGQDEEKEGYHAFYLTNIVFHPKYYVKGNSFSPGYWVPERTTFQLEFETYDGESSESCEYHREDISGKTLTQCLLHRDLFVENDELRADYLKETEKFQKAFTSIGRQYIAAGEATCLDRRKSNDDDDDDNRWWRRSFTNKEFQLPAGSRVVVDVVSEGKDGSVKKTNKHAKANTRTRYGFFGKKKRDPDEDEDSSGDPDEVEETKEAPIEIPIHPWLVVFHLSKHMRLKLHFSQLHRYKYDVKLIDKLVIDDMRKALVRLLIEHRDSKYADIISSKAGGAIVLLCGAPGTGKTLTAEVFAESEKRALYSVQCAQLGVTPEELEEELLKVLTRAARWNAVLLLDEADVYVHKRGKDIQQNAMVGVFLRVLEYQNAVMFMTTNRDKDVDDAVASRCTAKLVYANPDAASLKKIWRVLVDTADAEMSDKEIDKAVKNHPELSGRDVKNLLKLAMLVNKDKALTADAISFVSQFKPT